MKTKPFSEDKLTDDNTVGDDPSVVSSFRIPERIQIDCGCFDTRLGSVNLAYFFRLVVT